MSLFFGNLAANANEAVCSTMYELYVSKVFLVKLWVHVLFNKNPRQLGKEHGLCIYLWMRHEIRPNNFLSLGLPIGYLLLSYVEFIRDLILMGLGMVAPSCWSPCKIPWKINHFSIQKKKFLKKSLNSGFMEKLKKLIDMKK